MAPLPPKPHSKNRIEQQQLPHIYARHSPLSVSVVFFILAVAAIPIGVLVIVSGDLTTRLDFRYDHINSYKFAMGAAGEFAVNFPFNGTMYSSGVKTRLMFSLHQSLTAPVYMQYRLSPFFQNYRYFTASVDYSQLSGRASAISKLCAPFRFPGEATGDSVSGYYNPCGAYPWAMFNDSISLYRTDGTLICDGSAFTANGTSLAANNKCVKSGIARPSDVKERYNPPREIPGNGPMWSAGGNKSATDPYLREGYYYKEPGHKIPLSIDEDLIVWLDPAFTSDVTKNYRILNVDLPAGDYYFEITEQYPTAPYASHKFVQLATRSWIGGRSHVLGSLLIIMGGTAFIMAVTLLSVKYLIMPVYTEDI
uniref:Miltefosine transporter beta subunit n=1 Tax=Leishmania donovani TaxID=5661 RepID=Q0P0L8_LEIDO|nr:miltefosine transporter beta subunit [Leishmania donovani]